MIRVSTFFGRDVVMGEDSGGGGGGGGGSGGDGLNWTLLSSTSEVKMLLRLRFHPSQTRRRRM